MKTISVVIVNWNTRGLLYNTIRSIMENGTRHPLEIIVVDNNSSDGSQRMVEREFPSVALIRNDRNLGFARANNIGIKKSTGDYVCLINSDVTVIDDCIDRLYEYMEQDERVGIAGPKILYPDKSLQHTCRLFPSLWNNFCTAVGLDKLYPNRRCFSGEIIHHFSYAETRAVDALAGCFLMVRRKAIEQVGAFDERYFIYSEDVDWCKRMHDAGWKVVFYPKAVSIHYHQGSSSRAPVAFAIEQEKAVLKYWAKHHGWTDNLLIRVVLLIKYSIRIVQNAFLYVTRPDERLSIVERVKRSTGCMRAIVGFNPKRDAATL